MLKLRSHSTNDYSVLESGQRIGRIRLVIERMPGVWLWNVTVRLPGDLPMGSAPDFNTAKAEFKAAWKALKARTPPEEIAAAYKAMNIRDDG
jgi:hypothetical protein